MAVKGSEPPDVPLVDFDREDRETLRAMIVDFRQRKAVRETLWTWAKYLAIASGALIALTQLRDFIKQFLGVNR